MRWRSARSSPHRTGTRSSAWSSSYLLFDRCSREIATGGAVLKPKRGSTKSIARLSPHFTAMRAASAEAERLEAQLGLSTLRRSRAGKVTKRKERKAGADAFLGRKGELGRRRPIRPPPGRRPPFAATSSSASSSAMRPSATCEI
jgi:hypothetical protein